MVKKRLFKKKLGLFSKTIFLFNTVVASLLLLSYSASFINPKTVWPIAFLGLGFLPLLILNIGFVVYWLLRKPKYALLSFLSIILGWSLLNQHVGFTTPSLIKKDKETIRVMTFNAHLFKKINQTSDEQVKEHVIDLLQDTDPDILCIQEFFTKIKGTKKMTERIKREIGYTDYFFEAAVKSQHEGYGQVIFSKYPIIRSGTITENEYGINRTIFADVVKGADTIRVYNIHLRSFGLQKEDKIVIQSPSATKADEVATRKIGRKLKHAFAARSDQAEALRAHIDSTKYPILVMGDFNDTPMSYSVNLIGKGLKNTFREKGWGWGVTHYEMLPLFQIDYIFCSPRFNVENFKIEKVELSDHYPVWSDLILSR
ncbi:endonuclease/exonuclease/phosphatase family protein [Sphingobacterium sp. UT-1RO-CII-1]|uniref:endonuclease/exonuclease/phosphatase family protein n=1 Tax=Sphingobacterium sp. UT-1RO-CII-1 TaxID=2995225 RepID=UPI00227D3500|nr:endonuclease/exonuclease/phosphatase family protein [Sphingobacterium sp. UT-1RO-CII-1]MCY4778450.1 endonuclease/exonuclease/phosphatase family protein [Sphingobacterium sp. UT-1RO-CII-1]